jgi:hypothetical protein
VKKPIFDPQEIRKKYPEAKTLHPLAEVFGWLPENDFYALVEDIKDNGQTYRCWITDQQVLVDGKNRELACFVAGVQPKYGIVKDKNLANLVLSLNQKRRQQNESQRAMAAARFRFYTIAQICAVEPKAKKPSIPASAKLFNVSSRTINDAILVLQSEVPDLVRKIDAGDLRVSSAAATILNKSKPKDNGTQNDSNKMKFSEAQELLKENQTVDEVFGRVGWTIGWGKLEDKQPLDSGLISERLNEFSKYHAAFSAALARFEKEAKEFRQKKAKLEQAILILTNEQH